MRSSICFCLLAVFTLAGCGGPSAELPTKTLTAPDKDITEKVEKTLPKDKQN